jgi:sulfoxide reductase heme-binding subunit YedZ
MAGLLFGHVPQMAWHSSVALDQTDPTLWYLTRALAEAAYIALALSVMLGMLRAIARTSRERLSWIVDEVHAVVATLSGLLLAGHLVTLKLHTFYDFTLSNLLLPGDQPYRPLAVNLGVFALYTMTLVLASSWLRRKIPYTLWRGIHYLSFVAFLLVTAHGWLAGSDAGEIWQRGVYAGALSGVAFLTLMRFASRGSKPATAEQPVQRAL